MLNAYEIFNLAPDANPLQIKRAYRQKIRLLHPDYFGDEALEMFHEAEHAYRILNDPKLRMLFSSVRMFSDQLRFTPTEVDETTQLVLKNFSELQKLRN